MGDVQKRLDTIISAQGGSSTFALTDADCFIVVGLYLSQEDIDAIRPDLSYEEAALRYRGVPVIPAAVRPGGPRCEEYQGVWFRYVPMGHVETF